MIIFHSDQEAEILKEFQESVADLCQDEKTCLRFLRARNHDIKKAEDMLRKNCSWRTENKVDTCSTWVRPENIKKTFWYLFPGLDKEGRQVVYLPVGVWQTRKFIEEGWKDDLNLEVLVVIEDIIRHVEKTAFEQFYCIVDMKGSTYHKVAHYQTIQTILSVFRIYEANYPERLFRAVVINAPWVFSYIFPIVKPLISKQTLEKIRIFNGQVDKWKAGLMEDMTLSTIPSSALADDSTITNA